MNTHKETAIGTIVLVIMLLLGMSGYVTGIWVIQQRKKICQGKCAHGDRHCQQICLDRGFCPRERE